jgi:hypothetical protein
VAVQSAGLQSEIRAVGRALAEAFPSTGRHPLRAIDDKAMELAERDEQLRAALFRLVDVTPACRSLDDLAEHLASYLDEVDERPTPLDAAMRMAGSRAGRKALGAAAAAGVRHMAHRFIVGESPQAARGPIGDLWRSGIASSVDLLGEATVTEAEADRYAARCREMLETLAEAAVGWPERPALEADSFGRIPRVNVSVKVTALTPHMRPEAPQVGREDAARRLARELDRAVESFAREASNVLAERLAQVGDAGVRRVENRMSEAAAAIERQRDELVGNLEQRLLAVEHDLRRRLDSFAADAEAERAVVEARLQELGRRLDAALEQARERLGAVE